MQVLPKTIMLFALITILVGACGDDSEGDTGSDADTDTDTDTDVDAGEDAGYDAGPKCTRITATISVPGDFAGPAAKLYIGLNSANHWNTPPDGGTIVISPVSIDVDSPLSLDESICVTVPGNTYHVSIILYMNSEATDPTWGDFWWFDDTGSVYDDDDTVDLGAVILEDYIT